MMKLLIKNISKSFKNKTILNDINFELDSGNILAIVGKNGSGKTTLLKTIVGTLDRQKGDILIDNQSIKKYIKLKSNMILVNDRFDYFKYDKLKHILFYYETIYDNFDRDYFLEKLAFHQLDLNKKLSSLSKGQAMILSILLALASNPKFILLDEPLDGIDLVNINIILDYILDAQEKDIGVIIASHRLNYIEKIANDILLLDNDANQLISINDVNLCKYQVVYKEKITLNFNRSEAFVLNHIGRVYTIIAKDCPEFEKKLQATNPLQYDKMNASLEEIFLAKHTREG